MFILLRFNLHLYINIRDTFIYIKQIKLTNIKNYENIDFNLCISYVLDNDNKKHVVKLVVLINYL